MQVLTLCYLHVTGFPSPARDYQWARINANDPKAIFAPVCSLFSISPLQHSLLHLHHHACIHTSLNFQSSVYTDLGPSMSLCIASVPLILISTALIFCSFSLYTAAAQDTVAGSCTFVAVNGALWENKNDDSHFSRSFQPWGLQTKLLSVKRSREWPYSQTRPVTWPWGSTCVPWASQCLSLSSQTFYPYEPTSGRRNRGAEVLIHIQVAEYQENTVFVVETRELFI